MDRCCASACTASANNNQTKLQNSCGFTEPPPGHRYKKIGDPHVDERCGLLRTGKHNLDEKLSLLNYSRTCGQKGSRSLLLPTTVHVQHRMNIIRRKD
jgi:hypothetical protein